MIYLATFIDEDIYYLVNDNMYLLFYDEKLSSRCIYYNGEWTPIHTYFRDSFTVERKYISVFRISVLEDLVLNKILENI